MIESSAFFIIYQLTSRAGSFTSHVDLPVFLAAVAVIVAGFLLLSALAPRHTRDSTHVDFRTVFRRIAIGVALTGIVVVLAGYGDYFFPDDTTIQGLSEPAFLALLTIAVGLAVVLLVSVIVYRRGDVAHPDPSKLSRKQLCKALIVVSGTFLAFILLCFISKHLFTTTIIVIFVALEVVSIFYWFYDPFIYVLSRFSVRRRSHRYCDPTPGKVNRFAIIICAHNEEKVIERSVESVLRTAYPADRYDVFVVCDNCTDDTAAIAEAAGANVQVRTDPEHAGKGFALDWMFRRLEERVKHDKPYDAYIIIDADNLVNREFLAAINKELNAGYGVLQAYIDTKNPRDSWISKSSALAYCVADSIYQDAHFAVGLSSQIGGTGMIIRPEVLEEVEWRTDSLTEDLVYTAQYVLTKDKPVSWVSGARVFDEKPLKLQASLNQRTRWMQGHMAAMFAYFPSCIAGAVKNLSFRQFDVGLYLARPFVNLLMLLTYCARLIIAFILPHSALARPLLMDFTTAILLIAAYILIQLFILRDSNRLRYSLWFPYLWTFSYTWYPAIVRGILKRKERTWVSTKHDRAIAISDLVDEDPLSSEEFDLEATEGSIR